MKSKQQNMKNPMKTILRNSVYSLLFVVAVSCVSSNNKEQTPLTLSEYFAKIGFEMKEGNYIELIDSLSHNVYYIHQDSTEKKLYKYDFSTNQTHEINDIGIIVDSYLVKNHGVFLISEAVANGRSKSREVLYYNCKEDKLNFIVSFEKSEYSNPRFETISPKEVKLKTYYDNKSLQGYFGCLERWMIINPFTSKITSDVVWEHMVGSVCTSDDFFLNKSYYQTFYEAIRLAYIKNNYLKTIDELVLENNRNPVAFSDSFINKEMTIHGEVVAIHNREFGTNDRILGLFKPMGYLVELKSNTYSAQCYVLSKDEVANLSVGNNIVIHGTIRNVDNNNLVIVRASTTPPAYLWNTWCTKYSMDAISYSKQHGRMGL
ncbi:MAG: hypothetical protein IIV44_03300 [Rikenellaceae bacterium]|nr:hypothetical protein [Rikenellaceae bacterium]